MTTYLGVFGQRLIVSVQDMSSALDDVNRDLIPDNSRERMEQVLVEKIEQFRGKLHTSGTTTADHKRQQTLAFLVTGGGQTGQFHVLQHLVFDLARIVNGFQEVAVLETFHAMRIRQAA